MLFQIHVIPLHRVAPIKQLVKEDKGSGFGVSENQVQALPPLPSCVTLGKSLYLQPQSPVL